MRNRSHYRFNMPKLFGFNSWEKRNWGGDDEGETSTETMTPTPVMAPEYAESKAARGKWWDTLQDWGDQPGYGIIEPNYDNIYKNAQQRIGEHYFGGPLSGGGESGRVNASLARRGVADSPASSIMRGRMGAQMGRQLQDVSTQQDIARATAGEQARMGWLGSMQNLSAQKPNVGWGRTTTQTSPGGGDDEMWGTVGSIGGTVLGSIFGGPAGGMAGGAIGGGIGSMFGGGKTQSSITSNDNWLEKGAYNTKPWYG